MIDFNLFKDNFKGFAQHLKNRNVSFDIATFEYVINNLTKQKKLLEGYQETRNQVSKQIGLLKSKKNNADQALIADLTKQMKSLNEKLDICQNQVNWLNIQFKSYLAIIPNTVLEDVPIGKDEKSNKLISRWPKPVYQRDYEVLSHHKIGEKLDIFDVKRAAKIAKSRFTCIKGKGATLERAIGQFMIDWHVQKNGYTELSLPFLVNRQTMFSTGQLPKFSGDVYSTLDDMFLIPTAEVPITALFQNEVIDAKKLPLKFVSLTPCFRKEAGSYGKDTKGLIRQHQFLKVELVWITSDKDSKSAHQKLLQDAQSVLKALELPYQVLLLSSGDTGFCAAKCFDIEVFLASENRYREISSCSNCTDFQTRRANIKFKEDEAQKPRLAHSLNGSGLAVGRTMAAVLEHYQTKDGRVKTPKVLKKYLGDEFIL